MQSEFGEKQRVSSVSSKIFIAHSFAKDDDMYSLRRTGVDECSNTLECETSASLRYFT